MNWRVDFHPAFAREFLRLDPAVQDEAFALIELLKLLGPSLKRPHSDTLGGSANANLKELRFKAGGGVWRLAYAFDPQRRAILLVAGDKSGVSQKRFYATLIAKADARLEEHLNFVRTSEPKQ
jgi:hypothetical protein